MSEGEAIRTRYVVAENDKICSWSAGQQRLRDRRDEVAIREQTLGMQSTEDGLEIPVLDEAVASTFGQHTNLIG
jgi:PhoPQ-activated pathogenicity-related protein